MEDSETKSAGENSALNSASQYRRWQAVGIDVIVCSDPNN